MVKSQRRYNRLGLLYASFAILLVFLLKHLFPSSPFRTTVLLVGNPMLVASWDGRKKHVTVIELPSAITISGMRRVGEYSLESLWKLGELDTKNKALLADSLGETLGVVIPWYHGPKIGELPDQPVAETSIRKMFSIGNALALVMGRYRSNLPLQTFLPLALATQGLRTEAFEKLDVGKTSAIVQKELADGTTLGLLDMDRLDVVLGTRLEEEDVRVESLRVMVYNTTTMPTLGRRMERRISRAGALVVGIGNDSPTVGRCIILGRREALNSKTVRYIAHFYSCSVKEGETSRSDIEVRVGEEFEKRF